VAPEFDRAAITAAKLHRVGSVSRRVISVAAGTAGPTEPEGKTLVVTGTLVKYTRKEIQDLIARHGGRAAASVSKNTDYVVAGERAGSKLDKAQQLRVKVTSEEEFEEFLKEWQP
jgi:DNA ligase (NAD+)